MKNGPYELVIAPPEYPGRKYRGRYCYEHYLVWWRAKGSVPGQGEILHHKDRDKRHNVLSNLELLTKEEHAAHHGGEKQVTFASFKCPACGVEFVKEKRLTHLSKTNALYTVCSRRCKGIMSGRGRTVSMDDPRIRGNVIEEFKAFRAVVAVAS